MATASSGQHHASLNLMACVRESSPQQEDLVGDAMDADINRHDPSNKKRRFHPFRGLRRIFRKKVRHQNPDTPELQDPEVDQTKAMLEGGTAVQVLDAHRSRSTSTLLSGDETCPRRRSGNGLFSCHSGLSVSHDSVFTAEHQSPQSSSEDLDTAQSSSSLSIQQLVLPGVRAELFDALRRRGHRGDCTSEDDEDLGLPHSPCNSPTTADVLLEKGIKENPTKSHSTCSDGSLLSMGSSEMDEDSLCQHSGHSSKVSLHDKRMYHENDLELDLGVSATPLSHSAARHKMAVRPKRTHGPPRRKRIQQLAGTSPLPSTPELNEDASGRSASPDIKSIDQDLLTEVPAETQLKSASLPPGLALPQDSAAVKVKRCNSSIAQRQNELATAAMQHVQRSISEDGKPQTRNMEVTVVKTYGKTDPQRFGTLGEEEDEYVKYDDSSDDMLPRGKDRDDKKKDDSSFFSRLIRRSGKKKKEVPPDTADSSLLHKPITEIPSVIPKRIDMKGRYANETINDFPVNLPPTQHYPPPKPHTGKFGGSRSTPAARQRVIPINIPASPETPRKAECNKEVDSMQLSTSPSSEPESIHDPVPATRMQVSYSTSPPKPAWPDSDSIDGSEEPIFHAVNKVNRVSSWQEDPELRVPDSSLQTNVLHFRPKLRVTSYQHRIDLRCDERECSSLIDTGTVQESEAARQNAVKKSKSFRREIDVPHLSQYSGEAVKLVKDSSAQDCEGNPVTRESVDKDMLSDVSGRLFSKNTRSMVKETYGAENSPVARNYNSKHPDRVMKKSSSLDSIGSLGDSGRTQKSDPGVFNKKSSSSESISPQVAVPQTISITHTSREEVKTVELVNFAEVPKPAVISVKPLSPELQPTDITAKIPEVPTTQSADGNVNKVPPEKLEQSQLPASQRILGPRTRSLGSPAFMDHVPEFLKVQLNRVDNKPPTTSMVFDSTERSYSPSKSSESRQTPLKKKESSGKVVERNDVIISSYTVEMPPQGGSVKERKPSEESSQTEGTTAKAVNLPRTVSVGEELSKDCVAKTTENEATPAPEKQRTKSLPQTNASNRNFSIVSITSGVATTPNSFPKPALKKQAVSLDSADSHKVFVKKQLSNDSDDIFIVEKAELVHSENARQRKKSVPLDQGSSRDDDSVSSENGSVEIVPRSKKIISSKDLGIKKDAEKRESVESKKLGVWREEDNQKQISGGENISNQETSSEVVLRKKSLPRGEVSRGRDEEPELLKVFARRSLKLKDSESEMLGQQIVAKPRGEVTEQGTKSRDSDKENDGGDSPREERKKQVIKEPLTESKVHKEPSEPSAVLKTSSVGMSLVNTPRGGSNKYTRSLSTGVTLSESAVQSSEVYRKENPGLSPDKRMRSRTIPESPKSDPSIEKAWPSIHREKEAERKISTDKQGETNEGAFPQFKRIQQMKEEWEQRAQQGLKKTLP